MNNEIHITIKKNTLMFAAVIIFAVAVVAVAAMMSNSQYQADVRSKAAVPRVTQSLKRVTAETNSAAAGSGALVKRILQQVNDNLGSAISNLDVYQSDLDRADMDVFTIR